MNKNLPVEIWDMIEVERRKAFRLRVEEFEYFLGFNIYWKLVNYDHIRKKCYNHEQHVVIHWFKSQSITLWRDHYGLTNE